MSGMGISPLAIFDPETYGKELQIQQRQALANMLLEKGAEPANPRNLYSGLANAGNMILGAYLSKRAARDLGNLYSGGGQPAPTMPAQSAPMPSAPAAQPMPNGPAPQQAPPQQSAPPQNGPPPDQSGMAGINPQVARIYSNPTFPKVPGVDPNTAVMAMYQGGEAWTAYMKAYYDSVAQTPDMKNIAAAYGQGSPEYKQALQGKITKDMTVVGRPGGGFQNLGTGQWTGIPGQTGLTPTQMPNGQIGLQMAPGAAGAVAQSNFASTAGGNAATPSVAYVNGQPIPTNKFAQTGQNPADLGLPGGQQPFAGYTPPPAPPPPQPGQAGYTPSSSATGIGAPSAATILPELPAGQADFMKKQGEAAGNRFTDTVTEAEGAPDRVNVLNNIIQLSQQGALSGPGSDWFGHMAGVATTLGLKNFAPTAEKYQELTKFTYQNALRAWAIAGGTGTDNQMAAQMQANVNTHMNPASLQAIASWALAGEHAVMSKANAQQNWIQKQGNTPQAQLGFENAWRNAMDRRVFILQAMPPAQQKAYVQTLSPADAKELLQKRQLLRALGAF